MARGDDEEQHDAAAEVATGSGAADAINIEEMITEVKCIDGFAEHYESSGLEDDEEEFVGCESRSASEGDGQSDGDSSKGSGSHESSEDEEETLSEAQEGECEGGVLCPLCQKYIHELQCASEVLTCDGGCKKRLQKKVLRWACTTCDYDICQVCADPVRQAPPPASTVATVATRVSPTAPSMRERVARAAAAVSAPRARRNVSMESFREWQAQRAAAVAGTAHGSTRGGGTDEGAPTAPMAMEATQATTEATAGAATPSTDYALRPPQTTIQLADSDATLRAQIAELVVPSCAIVHVRCVPLRAAHAAVRAI